MLSHLFPGFGFRWLSSQLLESCHHSRKKKMKEWKVFHYTIWKRWAQVFIKICKRRFCCTDVRIKVSVLFYIKYSSHIEDSFLHCSFINFYYSNIFSLECSYLVSPNARWTFGNSWQSLRRNLTSESFQKSSCQNPYSIELMQRLKAYFKALKQLQNVT